MRSPELDFQTHIADFLSREHRYTKLEQKEINPDTALVEDHLWAFLKATQAETLAQLAADGYGSDARAQVFLALENALRHCPLWLIIREGLDVSGRHFQLYYPKPRSSDSVGNAHYAQNRIGFRPHFFFGPTHQEIDFVFFLNGLPIVNMEVKHEKNQNVHEAGAQYARRDHALRLFQLPFLHIAADTSEVKVATDPRREENFRWFNTGLTNQPITTGEYPVEYLYREVLSKERLLEALAFFLVYVPKREAGNGMLERPAYTLFPRYHQSRMVRKVADEALRHFTATGTIGCKFLINHSAGSGKTLSICWLADRLHSVFKEGTADKLVDMVIILTDRKSLDKNIREDMEKFSHLKDVVGLARRSSNLARFLRERKSIIVTTQQKFAWILDQIEHDPALKNRRVAFLIDEAHRSQEGRMGAAIRLPFRNPNEPDAEPEDMDGEEEIARIIRAHDHNQLFVAFTATPSQTTVDLFGDAFDTYSEAEAIAEGYIVDVASSIISFKTLYNLHCAYIPKPDEEARLYPAGVVAQALRNVAYQDEELIQYKAEVMLRIFEESVKPLMGGRAKGMIVASSRVAGLRYVEILKEKLRERGADYKVLFAFSDFLHPATGKSITEHHVNGLREGEAIEDRFEGGDYRLMVVANKFQTGFDQPLLAGMFIDKVVMDRNAVQTLSRLNRCFEGKDRVFIVDFTNNAQAILKAFAKYRRGTPFEPNEPDEQQCVRLYAEILAAGVFSQKDAEAFKHCMALGQDAPIQATVAALRERFHAAIAEGEPRRAYVRLLARFVKSLHFLECFFTYPPPIKDFAVFADYLGPQLIKLGSISELMQRVQATEVIKAAVEDLGTVSGERVGSGRQRQTPQTGGGGSSPPPMVDFQAMIEKIRTLFPISDEEALYIKRVTEEKTQDKDIRATVWEHREDSIFLQGWYKNHVNELIQQTYDDKGRFNELADPKYTDIGAIFDIMAVTVIQHHQQRAAF